MIRAEYRAAAPRLPHFAEILGRWAAVYRQRQALSTLDDAILRDIGVTREEAQAEAARPIWDAPDTWRR